MRHCDSFSSKVRNRHRRRLRPGRDHLPNRQHFTGHWSAPALFALEGANIGPQLGGQATDFVLLIMNPKGANSILSSKVKLGADACAAAGPNGRTAAADADIVTSAEVLGYSRSRGLFADISLESSTLRSDGSANKKLYGRSLTAKEIVREGRVGVPASGRQLVSLLDKKSPKNESDPSIPEGIATEAGRLPSLQHLIVAPASTYPALSKLCLLIPSD